VQRFERSTTRAFECWRGDAHRVPGDGCAVSGVPLVDVETEDPIVRKAFDRSLRAAGRVGNLYRVLAHSPVLLERWTGFAWALRSEPEVSRALRELSILRLSQLTGSRYQWDQHHPMALDAGATPEQIAALGDWSASDEFDADERLVLKMTDELTRTCELEHSTREALVERFGERGCVELVVTAAFYSCVSRILLGLDVPSWDVPETTGYVGRLIEDNEGEQ
jgi:4-carboxymuconolactone decarboxylase